MTDLPKDALAAPLRAWGRVDRLLTVVNLVALAGVLYLLLAPSGPVGRRIASWRETRALRAALGADWPALRDAGSRVGAAVADSGAVIVEFSDYQCPVCRRVAPALERLATGDGVPVVIRHFPLPSHPMAEGAARAAICAEAQGRFAAMHRQLFEATRWELDGDWWREAQAAGVADSGAFAACLIAPTTDRRLADDRAFAERMRVGGTPTLFSRRSRLVGFADDESLLRFMNRAR